MSRFARALLVATLFGMALAPGRLANAQGRPAYMLIDLGTFNGPNAALDLPAVPVTSQGAVLGSADTTTPDTDYPNFNPFENIGNAPDPYIEHAFAWQNGRLNDLGALPGNNSSAVFEVNGRGVGAGSSETSAIDPTTGWPSMHAVLFEKGQVTDLGTLKGGDESLAIAIDNAGQVAGMGTNGTADPYSMFGTPTAWRTFVWQNGVMRDIGDLGGPDATISAANGSGEVTGQSYTSDTPNADNGPACAPNVPTQDPFLWRHGHMQDLGTLGGTCGSANWMNSRGEVAGTSDLAGDQIHHGFLWNGSRMVDLGTLGGVNSEANWVNDAGDVVGRADLPGSNSHDAFLWKNGSMTDLGKPQGQSCSTANSINNSDQVVGTTGVCFVGGGPPFLWQKGTLYDLQALVGPTALRLTEALYINDQGEIAGLGVLPNGDQHVVLLVPAALAASEGLRSNAPAARSATSSMVRPSSPAYVGRLPRPLTPRLRAHRSLTG